MSDIRNVGTAGKARNRRIIKVAPMTRAVRSALAVSALTLAIGFGGNATAASHVATTAHTLRVERPAIDHAPVFDLTAIASRQTLGGFNPQVASLISQHYVGNVQIINNAPIIETGPGDVTGISGYSDTGNVDIINGAVGAISIHTDGNAIGIYGYAVSGNVSVANVANIVVSSDYGLADGIFASGQDVSVINTGNISAYGYSWAAGIEAQGTGTTTVTNTGTLYAAASSGNSYGIYVTGDDLTVVNSGGITARGYYATGIHTQSLGDTTITNTGAIDAGTTTGSALAWGINASSNGDGGVVQIDNSAYIHAAAVYGATGIAAVASGLGGTAQVNNSGDIVVVQNKAITSYGAYGILASGDAGSVIDNTGNVSVTSKGQAFGLVGMSTTGNADVSNGGNVIVTSTLNSTSAGATGILAAGGYGSATVTNDGVVKATGVRLANGVDASAYGDITIDNNGYIAAVTTAGGANSGRANGVKAISGGGDITFNNTGEVYAKGRTLALGVYAMANGGDITINNEADGAIAFFSAAGRGWGVWSYAADGDITVNNAGYIGGLSVSQAYGVLAQAPAGSVTVDNDGGVINITSANSTARGVLAVASTGTASISNSGDINVTSGGFGFAGTAAYGVFATGANADVANSGNIIVHGNTVAVGVVAQSVDGTTINNTGGTIAAYANGTAIGITASASAGAVDITNASVVAAVSQQGNATGITANGYSGVDIDNSGAIYAYALNNGAGIKALSGAGDVVLGNSGPIAVSVTNGSAIGLYAYSTAGNATVTNSGDISAESVNGLADGIFASGATVGVTNSGKIAVSGANWAAGIEAQGTDVTTVQNDGAISAVATGAGGSAFAIYATGDAGVVVGNTADLQAQGYYATGIEARSSGDIGITNSGGISAGYVNNGNYYSALAVGINATTGGVGAAVAISNSGDITALGYYGGNGISAVSSGEGGTVSVDNSGNITVAQGNKYGYGANGIITSADGDATVTNSGAITVNSAGAATGITALSFAGNANVTNSGDITATSTAQAYNNATGILAFSANGGASVSNSAAVSAVAADGMLYSNAYAIQAQGFGDVSVSNSGSLYANGKYAFGVYASSGNGNVNVDNADGASIGFYSYLGRGFGVFGIASNGDVNVTNEGTISGYAFDQSVGVFGVAQQGSTTVDSSGVIDITSGNGAAVGVFARADNGTAKVTNSGDISAISGGGNYAGTVAYGVIARGTDALVYNTGSVTAQGYDFAAGIVASGNNTAIINSSGSVGASAMGSATGILASSGYGSIVNSSSDVTAVGLYGDATGIRAQSVVGDARISSTGTILALSETGAATGVSAYTIGGDAIVWNDGAVTAASLQGAGNAIGVYAYSEYGTAAVRNTGALTAYSYAGIADGIFASGVVADVINSGAIHAYGYTWGAGIEAQGSAYVTVSNTGDIDAQAMPFVQVVDYYGNVVSGTNGGQAFGIYATGGEYGAHVANGGSITVNGGYATGIEVQSAGDLGVINTGNITVGTGLGSYYDNDSGNTIYYGTQVAVGINATSNGEGAAVGVYNSGTITADGIFGASGITAVASGMGGTVVVNNTGNMTINQANKYGSGAYGVLASGDGNTSISNSGDITVTSEGLAGGLTALSFAGDAVVVNNGDLNISNTALLYYGATGITAFAGNGDAAVGNYGSVSAISSYIAKGVDAQGFGDVTVVNDGSLYANGKYAYGVYAAAGTGDVNVINKAGGDIGFYSYAGSGFGVLGVATQGDIYVGNLGTIGGYAYSQSAGVFAIASQGDATVNNANGISVISGNNVAVGVFARADYGTATVVNSGSISATSGYGSYAGYTAYGIFVRGDQAQVGNSGSITAIANYTATGIAARADHDALVQTTSTSQITATAAYVAIGIEGRSQYGNVTVSNAGAITATGAYGAVGIQAYSAQGNSTAGNSGQIVANAASGMAIGVTSYAAMGDAMASNSSSITATGGAQGAYGISVQAGQGDAAVGNSGSITATSTYVSIGIAAEAYGDINVVNTSSGHIEATGGDYAIGVQTSSYGGSVVVDNAGIIHASGATYNAGVVFEGVYGSNTLNNSATGIVSADGADGYAFAVLGSDLVETINNSGKILGAINLYAGNDVFNNKAGGLWDVGSTTYTDFGDGNDTLSNAAGGTISISSGKIEMGAGNDSMSNAGTVNIGTAGLISFGDGNDTLTNAAGGVISLNAASMAFDLGDDTVNNAGLFRLTNSAITMGGNGGMPLLPSDTEINTFNNSGTLKIVGNSSIDTAGGTFSNTGLVDFMNGVTTDQLTLGGTLAGTGAMSIDVNLTALSADQLVVNGSVAANAVQTVNVQFSGMPTTANTKVSFANVTGTSAASNFVAGQFIGYNANANFLTIGLGVTSALNAGNTANDVFSISMDVTGLSDGGSLAASAASGAAGFMNSQMGTFRQRLGVNPYGDAGKVLSAFVRLYSDQGNMEPTHISSNFGSGGHFNFEQSTWGREFGINANLFGNFHAGLVLGNADSTQRLTDGGVGENRMNGMTVGGYLTWYVPEGFYVDFTARQMAADIHLTSSAGIMASRAHVNSYSLEGGYQWNMGGFNLVPQAQYTRTKVADVSTFIGTLDNMTSHGGTYERARLGVELNKTFLSGQVRWTPYASINAIHDTGDSAYTVANVFTGSTSFNGTSTMAEVGIGMQKGGFGFTLSANWNDGGAYKSFVGGQANIRYSW